MALSRAVLFTRLAGYSGSLQANRHRFGVAAHLEPEILIVDEVLAVGDAQFQKKCLGKMEEAGNDGRTIMFVSHNMGVISQLCTTCVWLDKGAIREVGETADVVNKYMLNGIPELSGEIIFADDPAKAVQLKKMSLHDRERNTSRKFDRDNPINIKFDLLVRKQLPGLYGYIGIFKPDGTQVLVSDSFDAATANPLVNLPVGTSSFNVTLPPRTLGHGDYMVHFSMASQAADNFHVDVPGIVCGFSLDDFTSKRSNQRAGFFSTMLAWNTLA